MVFLPKDFRNTPKDKAECTREKLDLQSKGLDILMRRYQSLLLCTCHQKTCQDTLKDTFLSQCKSTFVGFEYTVERIVGSHEVGLRIRQRLCSLERMCLWKPDQKSELGSRCILPHMTDWPERLRTAKLKRRCNCSHKLELLLKRN
jgi:hypothetical protein